MRSIYQYYQPTIAAGQILRVNAYSNFITLLDNSGSSDILISISGQSFQQLPKGISIGLPQGDNFKYLDFKNTSGASVQIKFSISSGRIFDNRVVISDAIAVNPTSDTIETPAAITVPTTAPGSPQIAADTTRREIIIQNTGSNPLWVGDSAVDGASNRGVQIFSGESIILSTTAAIYLRATGASTTASTMNLTK